MVNKAKYDKLIEEIIDNPIYKIRKDGTIWGNKPPSGPVSDDYKRHNLRKLGTTRNGYRLISYKNTQIRVHRIIYRKFIGKLDPNKVINHKDGKRSNNRPKNIELITDIENKKHALESGFILRGEKASSAKLTRRQVMNIKKLLNARFRVRAISRRFDVHHSVISDIKSGDTWKHIRGEKK